MSTFVRLGMVAVAGLALSACSIALTSGGEKVEVMQRRLAVLDQCENKGRVTVSSNNINIREEAADREILARNNAADMDGDVVVPAGEPDENGMQKWEVFKCN